MDDTQDLHHQAQLDEQEQAVTRVDLDLIAYQGSRLRAGHTRLPIRLRLGHQAPNRTGQSIRQPKEQIMSKAPTTKIAMVAGHLVGKEVHHQLESHRAVSSHQARRHHLYLKATGLGHHHHNEI
jgi:hypothetical protein